MELKNFVTFLKSIIVIILFIVYYQFFFKDVIASYYEDMTNIARVVKTFNDDEIGIHAPAFTICMEPASKEEVLEKYNITSAFFFLKEGSFEHLNGKKTMKEIIYETSFRLNEDFRIAITSLNHFDSPNDPIYLIIGTNNFTSYENEFLINVTEMYSLMSGMCYIIQSNLFIGTKYMYVMSIILQDNNMNQKPNLMHLTMTSDDDALGTSHGVWGDAIQLTKKDIKFDNKTTKIDLWEVIRTRILNCNNDGNTYQKCLAAGFKNILDSSNCTAKCIPMAIKSLHDKYFDGDEEILQTCNNLENEACLVRNLMKFTENISQCESQCRIKNYVASPQKLKEPTRLYLDDGERADLLLMATKRTRIEEKEYRIYDTAGLVGTVGGSLGLFLGFSFFGVISDVLDLLVKKITWQD